MCDLFRQFGGINPIWKLEAFFVHDFFCKFSRVNPIVILQRFLGIAALVFFLMNMASCSYPQVCLPFLSGFNMCLWWFRKFINPKDRGKQMHE